jgi:predicted ATPase
MEQATVEEAKQRIRKHRQPNDYSLSDPPEDAEAAATDATQMQQMQQRARPTREGTSAYVRRIRQHSSAYVAYVSSLQMQQRARPTREGTP